MICYDMTAGPELLAREGGQEVRRKGCVIASTSRAGWSSSVESAGLEGW